MKHRFSRRALAIISVAAVVLFVVPAALADLSENPSTLPSKNPTDLKGVGKQWTQYLPAATYVGRDAAFTETFGNPTTTGGGTLTIGKQTTKGDTGYITITIKTTDAGLMISNAMVTASGGQLGAVQIASTKLTQGKTTSTYTINLKLPGEQGTPPMLSIKWYTMQMLLN